MKAIVIVAMVLVASGCAGNRPKSVYQRIGPAAVSRVAGKAFRLDVAETPKFVLFTGGTRAGMTVGMLFGPIGALVGYEAAMTSARTHGAALVGEDGIADPVVALSDHVRQTLADRYGGHEGDSTLTVIVAVDRWSLRKDVLVFSASVRLVDAAVDKPLAMGDCRYTNADDPDHPTGDALLADQGKRLKAEIDKAVATCADAFDREVFPALEPDAPSAGHSGE
jgi:hypothetical protein